MSTKDATTAPATPAAIQTLAESAALKKAAHAATRCIKAAFKAIEDLEILLSRRGPDLDYLITVDDDKEPTEPFAVVLAGEWIIDRSATKEEAEEEAHSVRGSIARVAAGRRP